MNTKNKKQNAKSAKNKKKQSKRPTPFTTAGGNVGQTLGGYMPIPNGAFYGKHIGRFLGAGIGSIFGSGDYKLVGPDTKYNVLSGSVPQFSSTSSTNIVCHREYLQDFKGTSAFTNTSYPLNPGMAATFPWLASIAQNYQEYRIHGLVFEFRPLTTDYANSGVPGVVIMATNYNAEASVYYSKQAMENSEFADSIKPTEKLMHMVECAPNRTINPTKYVRTGAVGTSEDLRLYDQGNFQFATQGNSTSVTLGELWVTYCVEFFKPIIPSDPGGDILTSHVRRTLSTAASPFGTGFPLGFADSQGSLLVSMTPTVMTIPGLPGASYFVMMYWTGTAATFTYPTVVVAGGVLLTGFVSDTSSVSGSPQNGTLAVTSGTLAFYINSTLTSSGPMTITLGAAGSYPTTGQFDAIVTQIDSGASI